MQQQLFFADTKKRYKSKTIFLYDETYINLKICFQRQLHSNNFGVLYLCIGFFLQKKIEVKI